MEQGEEAFEDVSTMNDSSGVKKLFHFFSSPPRTMNFMILKEKQSMMNMWEIGKE